MIWMRLLKLLTLITVSSEIEYPISIDFLLNGDYKIFISKGNNYLVGYFDVLK